jgi:hypothetical protein
MDGQAERPSVREQASQSLIQDAIDKPSRIGLIQPRIPDEPAYNRTISL